METIASRPRRRNNSDLRHHCRQCRSRLKEPTDNPRRGFCTRFCFDSFYRNRCRVCEKDLRKKGGRGHASRLYCRPPNNCKAEAQKWPGRYEYGLPITPSTTNVNYAHSTGTKWRHISGPRLSPTAFRLATLEPLPTASQPSGLRASGVARSTIIGSRTMPPQVRSVFEWLDAGCPVVEVQPANAVLLTAGSKITESKVAGDPGAIPDFLLRQPTTADDWVDWPPATDGGAA